MNDLPMGPPQPAIPSSGSQMVTYVPMDYQGEPDSGVNVSQVLGMLRRQVWLIAGIAVLCMGAAAFVTSREKPRYRASALIRYTYASDLDLVLGTTGDQRELGKVDPRTSELMVLKSRGVAGEAVDREGLRLFAMSTGEPASFTEDVHIELPPDQRLQLDVEFRPKGIMVRSGGKRVTAAYGEPVEVNGVRFTVRSRRSKAEKLMVQPRETAVSHIAGAIGTETVGGTDGVFITFTSSDPKIAPRVVNAVVQVHQETNIVNARQEASRKREFFAEQLRETDSLLAEAQLELSETRTRSGVYSAESKFMAEQGNLMQVEVRREELRSQRRMYESVLQDLEQSNDSNSTTNTMSMLLSTPGVTNTFISQLFTQLVQYQSERDAAITGPWAKASTHPDVQKQNAMIAQTETKLIDAVRSQIASIDLQINALGGLSARAAGAMSQLPEAEVDQVRLLGNVEILRQMGAQLREAYQEARMEEAVETGNVEIVHLSSGSSRVPSGALMKLMLGLAVGLMLGGGAAFLREKVNNAIHHPEDITRLLQIPSLAVIPSIAPRTRINGFKKLLPGWNGKKNGGEKNGFIPLHTEAFLTLRTNLLFSPSVEKLKTLVVTSATPEEGKTVTSANLAVALAQQGLRILLVDCDLRRPSVAKGFGGSSAGDCDLTRVLLGEGSVWDAIRPSGVEGLDILPTLTIPPNPSELLGGAIMGRLLEEVSERYYMVIVDSSPLLPAADAAVLGARADAVLLVVRAGATQKEAAEQALRQLSTVGARVVGAILNDPDSRARHYAGYYRYQYYSYSETGA
jgi:succinoglycan biosynthesis transport protein ExoP